MTVMSFWGSRTRKPATARRRTRAFVPSFHPSAESLESRLVLSAAPVAEVAAVAQQSLVSLTDIAINQINVVGDQLIANTTLTFDVLGRTVERTLDIPLTLGTSDNPADPACPILDLEIGEIHLDLLGLNVDTSEICLSITAYDDEGLLGELLCGVANLLDDGIDLGDLTQDQLNGIRDVLNGAFDQLLGGGGGGAIASHGGSHGGGNGGGQGGQAGVCDILNLELGPVDLTVLGLNVHLDNCDDGPITVDITAERGDGNLLGNLLCGITHLLDSPGNPLGAIEAIKLKAGKVVDRLLA